MGRADALDFQCPVKCPPDAMCLLFSSTGPEDGRTARSKELGQSEPHLEGCLSNSHVACGRGEKNLSCVKPLRLGEHFVIAASVT